MDLNNKTVDEVRGLLKQALEEKEVAVKLERATNALNKASETISEMVEVVENKESELAQVVADNEALKTKVAELEGLAKALQEKLSSLQGVSDEHLNRAQEAEGKLAEIAKTVMLEQRVRELEEAKVLMTGAKLAAQTARIKEMSSEDFESYKEELVQVRSDLNEALKIELAKQVEDKAKEVEVAPADIEAAKKENASVLVNIELNQAEEGVVAKMNKLASAMAEKIKKENEAR